MVSRDVSRPDRDDSFVEPPLMVLRSAVALFQQNDGAHGARRFRAQKSHCDDVVRGQSHFIRLHTPLKLKRTQWGRGIMTCFPEHRLRRFDRIREEGPTYDDAVSSSSSASDRREVASVLQRTYLSEFTLPWGTGELLGERLGYDDDCNTGSGSTWFRVSSTSAQKMDAKALVKTTAVKAAVVQEAIVECFRLVLNF